MTEPFDILEEIYFEALIMVEEGKLEDILSEIKESINPFIEKIETDKSLVQLIVTTLLKKIVSPEQDIRLHMAKFEGGYSARGLDTEVTTRLFKRYFPKYANKETAFLTKATRTEIIWDFTNGLKLPLRSKQLIQPFLQLIDKIQNETISNQSLHRTQKATPLNLVLGFL
jgi:DNA (cytosine-5)-methyltransferase 1